MAPHIIVCLSDQLRAHEVGCYGNPVIRTPNIDRFAAEGVRCVHAVTPNPVCLPARSSLLSGQYSRTCCGTLTNTSWPKRDGGAIMPLWPAAGRKHLPEQTLPECLRAAGYHTAAIGKWHIDAWPDEVGFDSYLIPRVQHCHTAQTYTRNGARPMVAEGFSVDWELAQVREFLRERSAIDQPFFLYYNISPPHMPLADAPERYVRQFRPDHVPLRANVQRDRAIQNQDWWYKTYLWDYQYYRDAMPYTRHLPDGFDLQALTALYYGNVSWLDDTVAGLLAALESNGLAEDCLMVFASDHGDQLGSHGLMNKSVLYEESIRIPMLWRWPGHLAPRVIEHQVCSLLDLAPTLLGFTGIDAPAHMAGQDLKAVIAGDLAATTRPYAIIETDAHGAAIRYTDRIVGASWKGHGKRQLDVDKPFHFDLLADPYQLNPLPTRDFDSEQLLHQWLATTHWKAER
jgi:arylsulfatase A-like enzyme